MSPEEQIAVDRITRRRLMGYGGRTAAAAATIGPLAAFLAACGDDDDSGGSSETAKALSLQLAWIPDVESAGSFIADSEGYFSDEGLDMKLLPGGPDIAVEPIVQSGKAIVGVSTPIFTATAVNEGAALTIVGATFQKNPFSITSLADSPIKNPEEMVGKKIGVAAINETIWNAFLSVNDISEDDVEKVVIQADPTPLAEGEVDGIVSFYFVEPTYLAADGVESFSFSMGDFNLQSYGDVYVAKAEALEDDAQREDLVKVMRASQKGWQKAVDDPALGAKLAVDDYGKNLGLDLNQQTEQAKLQAELVVSDATEENGVLWMTDEEIAANIESMAASGTEASADLFSIEILEEVKG